MSAAGNENNINENTNANNFLFTIKGTKLYAPVATLSARDNKQLSCKEYKTKSDNKNTTNEFRYFLDSDFVGVNGYLFSFIQMKMLLLKDLQLKGITYQKELLLIKTSLSMVKTL